MSKDWFRRTSWTSADRADFLAHLKRARDKSQYLKIQAFTLESAGQHAAALEVITYYFEHHSAPIWNAAMYSYQALSAAALGYVDLAIDSFRRSVQAQRELPSVQTGSWLDFGEFVALNDNRELFPEILDLFAEFETHHSLAFPVQRFRLHAIRALIAGGTGRAQEARRFASMALAEASASHSGFSRHPQLGLVHDRHQDLLARTARWAAA